MKGMGRFCNAYIQKKYNNKTNSYYYELMSPHSPECIKLLTKKNIIFEKNNSEKKNI
jgi:hypothetical protein